ncbi:neutral/alkaline ceramidase [Thalassomonas sp. RHCl1]|uniref:neutral/alkaline ceramidase n=1 Tax=Thalassomonas sp. RHCl1 TaxID=2995320 RepID=UPI00248C80C3|nr:neutral/alkaline ceramidase [Thalassomonas sp. RHCl1]
MKIIRTSIRRIVPAALLACVGVTQAGDFQIGRGIHDITGPAAEVGMLGYADLEQISSGIHTRLHARAFIIAEHDNVNQRVVMVSADLGMLTQSVKQGVVAKLRQKYGDLYLDANVMLSPTHTHSGPGGLSHYALTNLTSLGYIEQNYHAVVDGIVAAIDQAHQELSPGEIKINQGELYNVSINRSDEAYQANPAAEKSRYDDNVEHTMTLLKFTKNNQDYAQWNWFPVHPVSMSSSNTLISADNKGYASYLFERDMGLDYLSKQGFVAAFAQANAGDVSPNLNLDGTGPGSTELESTQIIGQRQYDKAKALYLSASQNLGGDISYRHTFVDFSKLAVAAEYSGESASSTCDAALGYAFAAGTEDGKGPDWFHEGDNSANPLFTMVTSLIAVAPDSLRECHAEKEILLATGLVEPVPWTPDVLPLQLLKIGRLAVVALPSEITTMAGRRLMATVKAELAGEVDHVVLSGLANTYAGYVSTREEYAAQHYEGGHTIFGPHTLAGYQQEFTKLARAIKQNTQVDAGPALRELADQQLTFQTGVVLDNTPIFTSFGDVHQQVNSNYGKGQTAFVSFWTGHPKNDLKTQSTYLEVQRKVAGSWQKVADDNDWETFYRWKRIDPVWGSSRAEISWNIPADAPSGEYRILHYGAYKNGWTGNIHHFTGKSKSFNVN